MTSSPPGVSLWVVPVSDLGGVARHVLDVVRVGIPGWRLYVCCPEGPLADALRERGAAVLTAPLGPQVGLPATVRSLRRIVGALRPAIVHSHLAYADVAVAAAIFDPAIRLISTEHGITAKAALYHASGLRAESMRRVHSARSRRCDRFIAVSESTRRVMRTRWHPSAPIDVIYNGVDRSPPPTSPAEDFHVISLARLAPEKGLDDLLRAFAVLQARAPEARLTVAGAGPERDNLRRLAAELDLSRVAFPGFLPPNDLMDEAQVLVQLSAWENCSYSLLDACARGLGVVATDVGGNSEILPDQCLVDRSRSDVVAQTILEQAAPGRRPVLPVGWPSVRGMTELIAASYQEVMA